MNDLIEDIYPLSPMQKGMLFQSLIDPKARLYFEQLLCEIKGEIDIAAFENAWIQIVKANAVLRTVFDWNGDEPVQIVLRDQETRFKYVQITGATSKSEVVKRDGQMDLEEGFDLEHGPLIRLKLFKLEEKRYVLRISYHHILLDGNSMSILFEDFYKYYSALVDKRKESLAKRTPYKEYIRWLQSNKDDNAKRYWKEYLANYKYRALIPIDNLASNKFGVDYKKIVIPSSISDSLIKISRKSHVTLNNLLQTTWAILLHEISDSNDIVFGSTISGRPPDINTSEGMIGLFINTLPMRVRVDRKESFLYHTKKLQIDWAEMQEYSFFPLFEIKKQMNFKTTNDPFQSIFVYTDQSLFGSQANKSLLRFNLYEYRELTNYDFTVDVTFSDKLLFQLSYPTGVINDNKASWILEEYEALLKKFIKFPDKPLDTLLRAPNLKLTKGVESAEDKKKLRKEGRADRATLTDVQDIWKEALHIDKVSLTDNFFELGGDSITCLKIVSRLIQKGYKTTIKQVFENPTIDDLSKSISKANSSGSESTLSVPQSIRELVYRDHGENVDKIIPLSYLQTSILEDSVKNKSTLYHDQSSFTYNGKIDYKLFERAWNYTMKANSILRSVFYWDKKSPAQAILKKFSLKLSLTDLSDKSKANQIDAIERSKKLDLETEFDIKKSPPIRISLFKLANDKHVFLLSFSVLIMDGWCFALVLKDFHDYYESFVKVKKPPITTREPYDSYIQWLYGRNIEEGISYWKEYLKNISPELCIKRKLPKKTDKEYEISSQSVELTNVLKKSLNKISQKEHATINTIFQTAWAYTLHKISGKSEVIVGATVSGRPPDLKGSDTMIGLFFNDVPVRFKFGREDRLIDIAKRTQKDFSRSREYEYISATQIKKALGLDNNSELFQTLFIFENYPKHEENHLRSDKKSLLRETNNWRREASNIDMNVYVEFGHNLSIEIRYIRDLFDPDYVRKVLLLYRDVLTDLATKKI